MTTETKTRPSERAMRAAVEMEIHAAISSTTLSKAEELDKAFPAYDDMLAALKSLVADCAAYHGNEIRITCDNHGDAIKRMRVAREVVAKAEGR